jgi:hypothetical protein
MVNCLLKGRRGGEHRTLELFGGLPARPRRLQQPIRTPTLTTAHCHPSVHDPPAQSVIVTFQDKLKSPRPTCVHCPETKVMCGGNVQLSITVSTKREHHAGEFMSISSAQLASE